MTKAPYEITETGWGEFEIVVKIYFCDPNEKPVCFCFDEIFGLNLKTLFTFKITLFHLLKLFSTDPDVIASKRHLVNEYYDEIVSSISRN